MRSGSRHSRYAFFSQKLSSSQLWGDALSRAADRHVRLSVVGPVNVGTKRSIPCRRACRVAPIPVSNSLAHCTRCWYAGSKAGPPRKSSWNRKGLIDCKYLSRVLLKAGTGNRGKTVCALTPTPVEVFRFRTGGIRLALFFVLDERLRNIINCSSREKERGRGPDASAKYFGKKW